MANDLKYIQEIKSLNALFLNEHSDIKEAKITTPFVLKSLKIVLKKIKVAEKKDKKMWKQIKYKILNSIKKYKKIVGDNLFYKSSFGLNFYPARKMVITKDL